MDVLDCNGHSAYRGHNSKDEKVITLLSPVQDIVTHRGTVCNQKGSPRVHWIIETLPAKNQGLKLRDKKVISF